MSQIILDFGSGNTSKNDKAYIKKMYDELKAVDTGKHTVIIKWQLFEKAGDNIPLLPECFEYAYQYGTSLGYKVTSSVFDKNSLDFLLGYDPCFVKIANNRSLDWLMGEVPRKIPIYVSVTEICPNGNNEYEGYNHVELRYLNCISKYPATLKDYEDIPGSESELFNGYISDHTTNFDLWNKYKPEIIEWHFGLKDSTGLDAGPFMKTPEMLQEVL